MKNILLLSFLSLVFTGFTKETKEFTVVYIPDDNAPVTGVVIGFYQDGKLVQNKGKLENGRYTIKGNISEIKKGDLVLFSKTEKGLSMNISTFILEPGNTTIDASGGGLNFTGTPLQKEFTLFTAMTYEISQLIKAKQKELADYEKAKDAINIEKITNEVEGLKRQREQQWEKYYESKSNPFITAFSLEKYVTEEWINLEKAGKYYNNLPQKVKALADIKLFGEKLSKTIAITPGNKCPEFSLPNAGGKIITVKEFKNKYFLIDFWASWCGPCRAESPNMVALYNQYNSKGFEILHVSFDKDRAAWLKAIEQDKYTWTNVIDLAGMSDSKVAELFNITSIPKNLLIDRNGIIVARNIKGEELEKKLAELLKKDKLPFTINVNEN